MKPIITKVTITDFRSISSDVLELDNVVALVGANESGKTNLLRAIKFIKPPANPADANDPFYVDKEKDTRMLSDAFTNQQYPKIEYELVEIVRLINDPYLRAYVEGNKIETATITRQGNTPDEFAIELTIKAPPYIVENISAQNV